MLGTAGFATATPIWQCGDDLVLVGVQLIALIRCTS
jgi:hypothetical protein